MSTNSILNNTLSNTAQRFLDVNTQRVGQSIERVSSGIRTNRAADDVAGSAISEALRSDIRVLRQGVRNLNDGISLINVVEGALNEQGGALIRLKELATQGASGTIGDFERQTLQLEVSSLVAEINRIAATTEFNGRTLLDGSLASSIQVSDQASIQIGVDSQNASRINLNVELDLSASNSTQLEIDNLSVSTSADARTALEAVDTALSTLTFARGRVGAVQNRFTKSLGTVAVSIENLTAADSTIRDADIAEELALLTRNQIVAQASVTMVGQTALSGQNLLDILQ
ncbi:MAG: flagellin FliC [Nitrospina sp.]|jgi:flagellin|nr:flagellin FliC [Nitrospina sp.]MBT3413620.1 flagellin FliC [Nitrospina sp.]MBT3856108.1 flagellin FliC [Nitrospina sp.]MBT4388589.1 flagellin FliC [Nitrospina sp.]MBT4621596.1 flagellin FliC [Nitrospina sp.]